MVWDGSVEESCVFTFSSFSSTLNVNIKPSEGHDTLLSYIDHRHLHQDDKEQPSCTAPQCQPGDLLLGSLKPKPTEKHDLSCQRHSYSHGHFIQSIQSKFNTFSGFLQILSDQSIIFDCIFIQESLKILNWHAAKLMHFKTSF